MRRAPTEAESRLWHKLRDRRLFGVKFRRQHPIGPWIVDFFCRESKLVVEIDGGGHDDPGKRLDDARRTEDLERLGVRVLRLWNTDVLGNMDGVLKRISEAIGMPSP
jgi:very-short-patch-repair endonuclease